MKSYKNCDVHIWPKCLPAVSNRTIGRVEQRQCNNCLAVKISFSCDVHHDGEWIFVKNEQIVEPKFAPVYQGDDYHI